MTDIEEQFVCQPCGEQKDDVGPGFCAPITKCMNAIKTDTYRKIGRCIQATANDFTCSGPIIDLRLPPTWTE